MHRIMTVLFMAGSVLLVGGGNLLQHQAEMRQQKLDSLYLEIETLTESYEKQIAYLTGLYENTAAELRQTQHEKQLLHEEMGDVLERIESVESRNRYLEQILFNQQQTYRNAIAMRGSTMRALSVSSFTAVQYERAWTRLGAHGLKGTGAALVRAEEIYGVNSLILAAIAYHESAGGLSQIARDKNNLFGLGAYDHDPYRCAFSFNTKGDSIYYAANLLLNSYLSRWGRNYRGDNLVSIGVRYATDPGWATKVGQRMSLIARASIPEGR